MSTRALLFFILAAFSASSHAVDCLPPLTGNPNVTFPSVAVSGAQDAKVPGTAVSFSLTDIIGSVGVNKTANSHTCYDSSGIDVMATVDGTAPLTDVVYQQDGQNHAVWETGVPGIGVAFAATVDSAPSIWIPITSASQDLGSLKDAPNIQIMKIVFKATLVFTGRLKSGTYPVNITGLKLSWRESSTGKQLGSQSTSVKGTFTVQTSTCKLSSGANQSVDLPKVSAYRVDDGGAMSEPFSMALQCGTGVKVFATMTDASNPLNTTDVLSLGNGSSAKGVGVRIFRADTSAPVSFGPDSSANGNTNQWYVGTATAQSGGNVGLSFKAGYVKTAPTVTAGNVKAQSTITFSYQ